VSRPVAAIIHSHVGTSMNTTRLLQVYSCRRARVLLLSLLAACFPHSLTPPGRQFSACDGRDTGDGDSELRSDRYPGGICRLRGCRGFGHAHAALGFSDAASQPINLFNIVLCTNVTGCVGWFVTNQVGFDTGSMRFMKH